MDVLMPDLEIFRIQCNQLTTRIEYTEQKLNTIEKHLPVIIEELLNYSLEAKIKERFALVVTR